MGFRPINEEEPVFLYDDGVQTGPIPFHEARSYWSKGRFSRDAFYWIQGMEEWRPALHAFGHQNIPAQNKGVHEPQVSASQPAAERRPRVLVVDDDSVLCEIIRDILDSGGIDVETAEDYKPALDLLEQNGFPHYDCVVTDYNMPGGTGVDLARWIKSREHALQVLLLTAHDSKQVVKLGLRAGVCDFQEKPLRRKSFLAALHSAIQQTSRHREERAGYLELIRLKLAGKGAVAEQMMSTLVQRESSLGGLLSKLETIVKYAAQLEEKNSEAFPGTNIYASESPFQGRIGDLSLLELAQLLVQSGKTGELQLVDETRKRMGVIYFLKGKIVHAENGNDSGGKVLTQLMLCPDGYFSFFYGRESKAHTIKGDAISLLLEISSRMDERDGEIAA